LAAKLDYRALSLPDGVGFVIDWRRRECFDEVQTCFRQFQETHAQMSFEEALAAASRDEGFKATVYAINTLLIRKGVYTQEEFQSFFVEWVEKELRRKQPDGAS
jgi:hypothetical protein